MVIKQKTFEADTPVDLDTAVNAFTATKDIKDVLDVVPHAFSSAKYGTAKTFTTTVVYKE